MTMPFILDRDRMVTPAEQFAPSRAAEPTPSTAGLGWCLRIGDTLPDFEADTTHGRLRYRDWAAGHWTVFFSHPAAFTGVCTSEVLSLADAEGDLEERGIKVMSISTSALDEQRAWCADIAASFGIDVPFPMAADPSGGLSEILGMLDGTGLSQAPVRKTYIVDPDMQVRMIMEYPQAVGRSTAEILRAVDALQAHDRIGAATPADWCPGDDYMLTTRLTQRLDAQETLRFVRPVTSYLSLVSKRIDPRHAGRPALYSVTATEEDTP